MVRLVRLGRRCGQWLGRRCKSGRGVWLWHIDMGGWFRRVVSGSGKGWLES